MKRFNLKRSMWVLTVFFFTIVCCFSAQAAEKKVTFTADMKQMVSRTEIYIGDTPRHRLYQWVRIDSVMSSDPDFGTAERWTYGHSDSIAGSGTHNGYTVTVFGDGDRMYSKFEGTHKLMVKEGGAWETTIEGKFKIIGGAGKFENAKGKGVYTGTITADSFAESGEFEVEY